MGTIVYLEDVRLARAAPRVPAFSNFWVESRSWLRPTWEFTARVTSADFVGCTPDTLSPWLLRLLGGNHAGRLVGVSVGQREIPVRWPVPTAKMGREHPDLRIERTRCAGGVSRVVS
jgi:hypothetical protein